MLSTIIHISYLKRITLKAFSRIKDFKRSDLKFSDPSLFQRVLKNEELKEIYKGEIVFVYSFTSLILILIVQ